MTTAIFGLIGVVVGALTSGFTQWRMQRRSEEIETKTALRLALSDLYTAQALIRPVRETRRWGAEPTEIPVDALVTYQHALAAHLD